MSTPSIDERRHRLRDVVPQRCQTLCDDVYDFGDG